MLAARRQHSLHDFAVPLASLGFAAMLTAGLYFGTEAIENKANAAKQGTVVIAGSFRVGEQGDYSSFTGQRIAPQRAITR